MLFKTEITIILASTVALHLSAVSAYWCSQDCNKKFFNGKCDEECNTFTCLYDGGDCKGSTNPSTSYDYYDEDYSEPTKKPSSLRHPTSQNTPTPSTSTGTKFPTKSDDYDYGFGYYDYDEEPSETKYPTSQSTNSPSSKPTFVITKPPTRPETMSPTGKPSFVFTRQPTFSRTSSPTSGSAPTKFPTSGDDYDYDEEPSTTKYPSTQTTRSPTGRPSFVFTRSPTNLQITRSPTGRPSFVFTRSPTFPKTETPTPKPSEKETPFPTTAKTEFPTATDSYDYDAYGYW